MTPVTVGSMADNTVTTVDAGTRRVACRVVVDAPASAVFDLVADPHRHGELDGSGTVGEKVKGPHRLTKGAKFNVAMKQFGVPYAITSTVTELEEDRVVEWRHPLGHHWRWEMAELDGGRTQVTETWDYRGNKAAKVLELTGYPKKNEAGIRSTLEALATRFS